MENQADQGKKPDNYTEKKPPGLSGPTWWEEAGEGLGLGLFVSFGEQESLYLNSTLRNWLGLGEMESLGEDDLWERISRLVQDPARLKRELKTLLADLAGFPLIQYPLKGEQERGLSILLYALPEQETRAGRYGGFLTKSRRPEKQTDDLAKVFNNLLAPARQHSAAVLGNLQALAGNLQSWSPAVLDQILEISRQDLDQVCQLIDLGLSYARVIDESSLIKQQVPLIAMLETILEEQGSPSITLISNLEEGEGSPLVKIDPSLLKIALQVLVKELLKHNPPGQQLDVRVSNPEGFAVLSLEGPRILPLPGLVDDEVEPEQIQVSPELFLAQQILTTQGGDLAVEGRQAGEGGGMRLVVSLPSGEKDIKQPVRQEWRETLKPGSGRILLAEAQPEYQLRIREALTDLGYRVDLAVEGSTVLDLVQIHSPDLVILARNLPGMDGLLVTQGIRRWSAVPILMISMRDNMDDLLYAYRLGVDDYLQKPFLIEELLAKVEVFLSRRAAAAAPEIYQEGSIRIDHGSRQVWVRGEPVQLTPIEYNLLDYLSRQGRQIIPYEQLLVNVWEGPEKGTRQGLFVHVRRLREKIELDPKNPQIITNKWGVGYVFNP